MARTSTPLDQVERIDAETEARTALNEEAERVMAQSKPTPTQKENDLLKVGAMHPDDKEDPNNPEMPSVAEQQRRIAEAGHRPSDESHQMRTPVPQRRSVEAGSGAPYMTREAAPRGTSASAPLAPASTSSSPRHPPGPQSTIDKDKDKDGPNKP